MVSLSPAPEFSPPHPRQKQTLGAFFNVYSRARCTIAPTALCLHLKPSSSKMSVKLNNSLVTSFKVRVSSQMQVFRFFKYPAQTTVSSLEFPPFKDVHPGSTGPYLDNRPRPESPRTPEGPQHPVSSNDPTTNALGMSVHVCIVLPSFLFA
jgi:hypothetical protein